MNEVSDWTQLVGAGVLTLATYFLIKGTLGRDREHLYAAVPVGVLGLFLFLGGFQATVNLIEG
ncbi:hypothetical protein ACODT3_43985 [Streptomyces sp. 4.24]|uniref:hypothetical protein n=1 Tax=Streptomyces tritrimontium TaxID=3406573 RepID=UPI003BB4B32D